MCAAATFHRRQFTINQRCLTEMDDFMFPAKPCRSERTVQGVAGIWPLPRRHTLLGIPDMTIRNMTRVLVTGAGGFIGREVVRQAIARGLSVRALVRTSVPNVAGVDVVRHDLREARGLAAQLENVDAVIHCAASLERTAAAQENDTIAGTRHLVAAMREAGVLRVVLFSSFAVYDYRSLSAGSLLTEASPVDRTSEARGPYPSAKLTQEELVTGERDTRWTILRPGLVFGPDRTWFHHLGMQLNPRLWVTLAGSAQIPLAYVEHCAAAALDALSAPRAEGRVVNIVDDELPTRAEYVAALATRSTPEPRVVDVPWPLLNAGSSVAWGLSHGLLRDAIEPPGLLHPARLHARAKPVVHSNALAKDVLGWRPKLAWREALARSIGTGPRVDGA